MMKVRFMRGVGLLAVSALAVTGGPMLAHAGAARPSAPAAINIKWTAGPDSTFLGTRFDGALDKATKRVYFLGMRTSGDATDGEVWYYDVAAKTYNDAGVAMPVPVSNYEIAPLTDSKGFGFYIFGGRDANAMIVKNTQVFYPATNTAKDVTSDPWPGKTPSGCISLPAMGVTTVGNKAVVMGGLAFSANGCVADEQSSQTWVFDPKAASGSKWKKGPKLNVARGYITTAVLGTTVYAMGGDTNEAGSLVPQAAVEKWKFGGASWNDSGVADLPEPCDESQGFGFNSGPLASRIVFSNCGQWPSALADTLLYDATKDSWTIAGAINHIVRNEAGVLLGSAKKPKLFIVGGYGDENGFTDPVPYSEFGKKVTVTHPAGSPHASGGSAHGASTS